MSMSVETQLPEVEVEVRPEILQSTKPVTLQNLIQAARAFNEKDTLKTSGRQLGIFVILYGRADKEVKDKLKRSQDPSVIAALKYIRDE